MGNSCPCQAFKKRQRETLTVTLTSTLPSQILAIAIKMKTCFSTRQQSSQMPMTQKTCRIISKTSARCRQQRKMFAFYRKQSFNKADKTQNLKKLMIKELILSWMPAKRRFWGAKRLKTHYPKLRLLLSQNLEIFWELISLKQWYQ